MAELYYIIGASGAGKDSLIDYLRHHSPGDAGLYFVQRYITRPANAGGENHIALSEAEFLQRQQRGDFAMHWFSHDTYYGIDNEIQDRLGQGQAVVMNGSRGYLAEASQRFAELVPILISVDPDVLQQRLTERGRESAEQIQQRLRQALELEHSVRHPRLIKIENNGQLADAGEQLLATLLKRKPGSCV